MIGIRRRGFVRGITLLPGFNVHMKGAVHTYREKSTFGFEGPLRSPHHALAWNP